MLYMNMALLSRYMLYTHVPAITCKYRQLENYRSEDWDLGEKHYYQVGDKGNIPVLNKMKYSLGEFIISSSSLDFKKVLTIIADKIGTGQPYTNLSNIWYMKNPKPVFRAYTCGRLSVIF